MQDFFSLSFSPFLFKHPHYSPHIWRAILLVSLFFNGSKVLSQAVVYSSPVVITKGGTYTGNWESRDSTVPAVMVQTSEPVVIENANIRGAGHLIRHTAGANLTVRNCRGFGLTPSVDGVGHGRFLVSRKPRNLVVLNNYFENTAGILVHEFSGSGSVSETIKVMRNKALNINGTHRDGLESTIAQFLQFNQVVGIRNIEIGWNEVINEPGKSAVEDNINMYNSSGKADSPLRIHNNFIKGGYPVNPQSSSFSGGGIITDGSGTGIYACAYVHAFENVVVSTTNYGMGIAAGNNNQYYNNRVISSGLFADGTRVPAQYSGIWLRNYYNMGPSDWYNNANRDNVIAWVKFGTTLANMAPDRHDISRNACENCPNNTHLPNPVPFSIEEAEYQSWLKRCTTANITVGVMVPAPANVPPVVRLTSPVAGGSFKERSTITLTAAASDSDGSISKVEFFQGGTRLGEVTASPYTFAWTNAAPGSYTLTARATDNAGESSVSGALAITVVVNLPPVVGAGGNKSLTLPYNAVTLVGSAHDPDGAIAALQWTKQTGPAATMGGRNTPNLYLSELSAGTYVFRLTATDNDGATGFGETTVTVAPAPLVREMVVTITSPAHGASFPVGASVTIKAEVKDNAFPVKKVTFLAGGVKLGEDATAPYSFVWAGAAAGTHTLKVEATDEGGATAFTEEIISVEANQPPVVSAGGEKSLILPANTLSLSGSASDPDGSIVSYLWTKRSGPAASMTGNYSPVLSLAGLSAGTYVFRLTVTDNGRASAFDEATVEVSRRPNQAPSVSLSLQGEKTFFAAGATITLGAKATDPDGRIVKVEFYQGATKIGEDATAPYSFAWAAVQAGAYHLTALAYDDEGASAVSAGISIVVAEIQAGSAATGSILREMWSEVAGATVANAIPLNKAPNLVSLLSSFEGPANQDDDYVSRFSGYVHPPVSGNYIFWVSGDQAAELWLSTGESSADKLRIAFLSQPTLPREWDKSASQRSAPIALQAGRKYYIEALHKESIGEDHLAVGWQLPEGKQERPIPGNRISPFSPTPYSGVQTSVPEMGLPATDFRFYPNPAQGFLMVDLPEKVRGEIAISITDGLGRVFYAKTETIGADQGKITVDLTSLNLPGGMYFVRVKAGDAVKVSRFAKR